MPRNLRQLAEGKPCFFRLPEFCRRTTEHTVLCHFRIGGIAGGSQKSPDVCAAPGCDMCHAVIDGRLKQDIYTPEQLRAESHRAHNQWLAYLWENEYLIAVVA